MCRPTSTPPIDERASSWTGAVATLYVLIGICQPLLMSVIEQAGLADPTAQIYMLFYYLGPSMLLVTLLDKGADWPSFPVVLQGAAISILNVAAQIMNFTGAVLSGPTIFGIFYSTVAIWVAIWSRILLGRRMTRQQWMGIIVVFVGLAMASIDSVKLGTNVTAGTALVLCGSASHALTHVLSERCMIKGLDVLTARQMTAVQSVTALTLLTLWQIFFTLPRYDDLLRQPMGAAGTSLSLALMILGLFALTNLIHSYSFFYTLKHFPCGSVSAGVMTGLQAVLVFVVTDAVFCGRFGGPEMCFSFGKFISLFTVAGGATLFGLATSEQVFHGPHGSMVGYERLQSLEGIEIEPWKATRSTETDFL